MLASRVGTNKKSIDYTDRRASVISYFLVHFLAFFIFFLLFFYYDRLLLIDQLNDTIKIYFKIINSKKLKVNKTKMFLIQHY